MKHYLNKIRRVWTSCTKKVMRFWQVCAHFFFRWCYYNSCKNPPIHYIKFLLYPIVKIPSPKKTARAVFFSYTRKCPWDSLVYKTAHWIWEWERMILRLEFGLIKGDSTAWRVDSTEEKFAFRRKICKMALEQVIRR